ncbi:MAG TPA: sulfotransferase [Acidimicrobiia bacterium]
MCPSVPESDGPHFLGIGAQKAGTTGLHANFSHHPLVWMPPEKELHYFDEKLDRTRDIEEALRSEEVWAVRWRRQVQRQLRNHARDPDSTDLAWCARYFVSQPDDGWYRSLFAPGRDRVSGEFTPEYALLGRRRIGRVRELNPDLRIIYMLRNPIERAWSAVHMTARARGAQASSQWYLEALQQSRVAAHTAYASNLDRWLSVFPAEQLFLGYLEDLSFHPRKILKAAYTFLGVEQGEYRVVNRKVHSGGASTIPTPVAERLAAQYHDDLVSLADRFGGHASTWLAIAEQLLDDPPDQPEIGYPFWEGDLAAAVAGYRTATGVPPGPFSGPLA